MKKQSKKQDVVLVKATSVAAVLREAEAINRALEIEALDLHLTGCPLDLVRAARYAVRHHGISVDAAAQAVKLQAQKRRDAIAREDAERRRAYQFESEKSREEKKFAEALEKVNAAIENEADPFLKGFLISAIPEEPVILRDGSTPKVRKEKVTEKTTTKESKPREGTRTAQIEALFPCKKEMVLSTLGLDSATFSKYLSSYKDKGKWSVSSDGTISLA